MASLNWYWRKKLKQDLSSGMTPGEAAEKYKIPEKRIKSFYADYIRDKTQEQAKEEPKLEVLEIAKSNEKNGKQDNGMQEEKYLCGDCNGEIKQGTKFCPSCGAGLIWE